MFVNWRAAQLLVPRDAALLKCDIDMMHLPFTVIRREAGACRLRSINVKPEISRRLALHAGRRRGIRP